jgi:hypothetical protein
MDFDSRFDTGAEEVSAGAHFIADLVVDDRSRGEKTRVHIKHKRAKRI